MGAGNGRGILTIPAARLEQMWRTSTAAAAMFAAKWESYVPSASQCYLQEGQSTVISAPFC